MHHEKAIEYHRLYKMPTQKRTGHIYFVRAIETKFVKIGFAENVKKRVNELQVGCPFALLIEHTFPSVFDFEAYLHEQFNQYHYRGEWFVYSREVKSFIDYTKSFPWWLEQHSGQTGDDLSLLAEDFRVTMRMKKANKTWPNPTSLENIRRLMRLTAISFAKTPDEIFVDAVNEAWKTYTQEFAK